MHYAALATDYDGTLANDGRVEAATWGAIAAFRQQGGKVLLVTGREFDDLLAVCPHLQRFDGVIAENGAVLYWPQIDRVVLQGTPPPTEFLARLRQEGVDDIQQGRVIVATWQPHGAIVQRAIAEMELDYQVILNKRAVMVLPTGVDKAAGVVAALQHLGIDPASTVGVGDAENDSALLNSCGLRVAVGNALPSLKAIAHRVTSGERGAGVRELIDFLLSPTETDPST